MIFNLRTKEVLGVVESNNTKLVGSYDSVLKINEIGGVCEQGENPTPTNPQEIKNSVVSGIKAHRKNFFGFEKSAIDVTAELRPSSKQRLTFSSIDDNPNRVKCNYTGGGYSTGYIAIYGVNGTKDWSISYDIESNTTEYTPVVKKDNANSSAERLVLAVGGGNSGNGVGSDQYFVLSNIMVSEVATPYEPYTEYVSTLSQPIELYGVGDVHDVITPHNIKRKFAKVVLDGSSDENWTKESGFDYVFRHRHELSNVISYSENQLSTHLLRANSYNESTAKEGYFAISSTSIIVNITGITTSPDLKSFLAENPMTFIFELAEPVIEELPKEDQIALNSLQTFNGVTYVEFDSEVQPTLNSDYATSPVGAVALSVNAYNEIEKSFVTYNTEDGSANFTGNINGAAYVYGKNLQARQAVFAELVKTWYDVEAQRDVKAANNVEAGEYVVGNNLQAKQMVFAQAVEASMNLISKGGITGVDLNITNLGINGGAPQPVEWVWDSALSRWVLCSTETQG